MKKHRLPCLLLDVEMTKKGAEHEQNLMNAVEKSRKDDYSQSDTWKYSHNTHLGQIEPTVDSELYKL